MWIDPECKEMAEARQSANRVTGSVYPHKPHLSLVYGDLSQADRREIMRHPSLRRGGRDSDADAALGLVGYRLPVRELWLMNCSDPNCKHWDWRPLRVYPLPPPPLAQLRGQ